MGARWQPAQSAGANLPGLATEMQAQVGTAATADRQKSAGAKRKPAKRTPGKGAQGHKGKTTHSKKPTQPNVQQAHGKGCECMNKDDESGCPLPARRKSFV